MKKLFLLLLTVSSSLTAVSQYYQDAIGLRANDYYVGLSFKKFTSDRIALDFTLNADFDSGFGLTGLYEIHEPTGFVDRLNWYYGFGGHISLWSGTYYSYGDYSIIGLGVDGVVGIEYSVENIPFAFSLDYIPSFSIITQTKPDNHPDDWAWDGRSSGFRFNNWTLGVKYTFSLSEEEKKVE